MIDLSKNVGNAADDIRRAAGSAFSGAAETVKSSARDAAHKGGQVVSQARDYATDAVRDGTGRAVHAGTGAINELSGHVRAFPVVSAVLVLGGFLAGCLVSSARR